MPNGPYSVFDGYTLSLHRADGSVVGLWPAISGQPGYQRPSDQGRRDIGPIPEGNYSYPLDQVQYLNSRNEVLGLLKGVGIDRGGWPGSMWAWGTQRVFLVPNASIDARGRKDFSIHGGF